MTIKQALKSRTIWFAIALGVLGVIQTQWDILDDYLSPEMRGVAITMVGALVAILRVLTTVPINEK